MTPPSAPHIPNDTEREWAATIAQVDTLITRDFGTRCPDYNALCATCRMWRSWDDIADIAGLVPPTPRYKRHWSPE